MNRLYFLLNNNYHKADMCKHLSSIKGYQINVICIPHALEIEKEIEGVQYTQCFESPFCSRRWWNPFIVRKINRKIVYSIRVHAGDVLILYTEFDPLNLFLAAHFKRNGAKVFLLEEGVASYLMGEGALVGEKLDIRERAKELILKYCYGYGFLRSEKLGGVIYYRITDDVLDGVLLYRDYELARAVRNWHIDRPHSMQLKTLDKKCWVFFSSPLYFRYLDKSRYVAMVSEVARNIPKDVTLFIRFHPREDPNVRDQIVHALPDCPIIEDELTARELLQKYQISIALSHISSALFEVDFLGVMPVFLCETNPELQQFTNIRLITEIARKLKSFLILRSVNDLSALEFKSIMQDRDQVGVRSLMNAIASQ